MPNTPRRSFRASDDLWSAAQARAAREGDELSTILVRALLDYARDDDARLTPLPAGAIPNALPCESCQAPIGTPCVAGCFGAPPDYPSTREADVELDAREAYTRRMGHDRPLAERAAAARDAYQDAPGDEMVELHACTVDPAWSRQPSVLADYPSTREADQDSPGADEPCLCAAFPARHARSDHTR